jgi:3-methyladenine DNA glycosylase AlkD
MGQFSESTEVIRLAEEMDAEVKALPVQNTPSVRAVRRKYSRKLKGEKANVILELARELHRTYGYWSFAFELIESHDAAFARLGEEELTEFGQGMNSWWSVDSFGRTLAGPAWLKGQVSDELIHKWAGSEDRWWRRAALVSTVALNVRSHGGSGDTRRTLGICKLLVEDHDDMVVKAMSWALRELVVHDPEAVEQFLSEHEDVLAARVKREVRNKLYTGLKNPRRSSG